ncbi:MAG: hypothetical protein IJO11_08265, partial [Alphaproteobacteria bacterium]|nr:hypothetical protein [Alphaproteobacteria bacterium]
TCPASKPTYNANKVCVTCASLDSAKPAWSTTNKKCDTCYAVNNAKPYWNGSACAACPSDKPYWDGTQCVATCPASKPTYNANKVCVTCASLDSAKPAWSTTNKKCDTCYAVNNAKPYWNGSACAACPTANPIWNGSSCITTATWCTNQMKSGGFSSGYSVSGSTITYNGNMTVSKNLDISKCNLTVNGTLTVSSGITLKSNSVNAQTTANNYGINNYGTMTITNNITGKGKKYGVYNQTSGKITSKNMIVTATTYTSDCTFETCESGLLNAGKLTISNNIIATPPTSENGNGIKTFSGAITQAKNLILNPCIGCIGAESQVVLTGSLVLKTGRVILDNVKADFVQAQNVIIISGDNISVRLLVVNQELNNILDTVLNVTTVYANVYEQEFWMDIMGNHMISQGKINSSKIYYCSSINGLYSSTPIKKCITACTTAKPIWNGTSCEACPTSRPTFNATYGVCE